MAMIAVREPDIDSEHFIRQAPAKFQAGLNGAIGRENTRLLFSVVKQTHDKMIKYTHMILLLVSIPFFS